MYWLKNATNVTSYIDYSIKRFKKKKFLHLKMNKEQNWKWEFPVKIKASQDQLTKLWSLPAIKPSTNIFGLPVVYNHASVYSFSTGLLLIYGLVFLLTRASLIFNMLSNTVQSKK